MKFRLSHLLSPRERSNVPPKQSGVACCGKKLASDPICKSPKNEVDADGTAQKTLLGHYRHGHGIQKKKGENHSNVIGEAPETTHELSPALSELSDEMLLQEYGLTPSSSSSTDIVTNALQKQRAVGSHGDNSEEHIMIVESLYSDSITSKVIAQHGPRRRVKIHVTKDTDMVSANVGHDVLSHFISGEVRSVSSDSFHPGGRAFKHWAIQIGPFAEHTILAEKKGEENSAVSLSVDGQPFMQTSFGDHDGNDGVRECKFRFIGEKCTQFDVRETGRCRSTDRVIEKHKYVHECCVKFSEDDVGLFSASLTVDGVDFDDLPSKCELVDEARVCTSCEALQSKYGLTLPYKAPRETACHASEAEAKGISWCCNTRPVRQRRTKDCCF